MASLDFPASPTVGQTYTANGSTWTWDGVSWLATNAAGGGGGPSVGAVQYFAENSTVGADWLPCDGSIISQATYPSLYTAVGDIVDGFDYLNATDINTFTTPYGNTIYQTIYDGSKYVAVGTTGYIATSTDAITWTTRSSGTINSILKVVYNGSNLYIAGGSNSYLATSTDAITWTTNTGLTGNIQVFYANGQILGTTGGTFLDTAASTIYTSTDGITWTSRATPGNIYNITYANSTYVANGFANGRYFTSTDTITWSASGGITGAGNNMGYTGMLYNGSIYLYAGGNAQVGTSTNLTPSNWTYTNFGTGTYQSGFVIGSTFYLASSTGFLASTTNGTTFSTIASNNNSNIYSYIYNGSNKYVVTGGNAAVRTSTDNITWNSYNISRLATNNSIFVGGGAGGAIATSTDAITWTNRLSGTSQNIVTTDYLNGKFVLGTAGGTVVSSTDGITWSANSSGFTSNINQITYGGGLYLLSSTAGQAATSTDAITWTTVSGLQTTASLFAAYFNSKFYLMGANVSRTSTDGITWGIEPFTTSIINNLAVGNGKLVIHAGTGLLQTTDGINFKFNTQIGAASVTGPLIFTNGYFVVLSLFTASGPIISKDGVNWYPITRNFGQVLTSCAISNSKIVFCSADTIASASLYSYNTSSDFAVPNIKALGNQVNTNLLPYIKAT